MSDLSTKNCLCIMGTKGSGKDTLAGMVKEFQFGTFSPVVDLKWSYALKEIACLLYGWDMGKLDDLEYKEEELPESEWLATNTGSPLLLHTRRQILQWLGTEVFREQDPDIWVDAELRRMRTTAMDAEVFFSSDTRFPNEQQALVENFRDVTFVKIHIAGGVDTGIHSSETGIADLAADMEFYVHRGDLDRMRDMARIVAQDFFRRDFS
jgi:hypothetical protein